MIAPAADSQAGTHVGVIGAGLGGLAAACTLAARGYRVTLFERNGWLGGKAAVLHADGFRFDMGPTILTVPSVLRRVFDEAGVRMEDRLDLVALDPQWRCFFEDKSVLDLVADTQAMKQRLHAFAGPKVASGYERFLGASQRLHEISERFFFWKSVGGIMDTLDFSQTFTPAVLSDLLQLRMGKTVAASVRSYVPEARVAQMIDHFTQYVGSSPDASPAVLCGIAHMQTSEGIWYPMGGTRAVPEALEKLAGELGVEFRLNAPVAKITVERGEATGVVLEGGERVALDAVVSNSDSVLTHEELLGGATWKKFRKRRKYEPACSGVVLYLGLTQRYDQLLHHNFIFSRDPHEEFEAIYRRGETAPDPTCYVAAPATTEAAVAPEGGEALYILVHTPYRRDGQDWSKMLPAYRQVILDKLKRTAGLEDIEQRIVSEHALTPQDIEDRYHVPRGAIYGLASHGRFLGAFKPANRSRDVKNLYLAGGAAHPGPGMPMVLMSGWIAADSLDQDLGAVASGAG
ncbi:Diapolycopene oxygenase [Pirellulimonas nuda]|uniref:Diapolycopene oxygenase n=1 Tax=Pirellulimonas nuda TaxID=2528009 RepID=A0A518DGM2_9BACT|nr:phytoene desaturase family protein [Pirellulimonas nuda]QDU90616.1 Diapolycopene oxygenase [Pirellulimonas nuda]